MGPGGEVTEVIATQNSHCSFDWNPGDDPEPPPVPPTPIITAPTVWIVSVDSSDPAHTFANVGVPAASNSNCNYDDVELFVGGSYNAVATQPHAGTFSLGDFSLSNLPLGETYVSVRALNATCNFVSEAGFSISRSQNERAAECTLVLGWLNGQNGTDPSSPIIPIPMLGNYT